jgi:hypothetical protein
VAKHIRSVDSKNAFLILAVLRWLTNALFPHEIMVNECRKKDLLKRLISLKIYPKTFSILTHLPQES